MKFIWQWNGRNWHFHFIIVFASLQKYKKEIMVTNFRFYTLVRNSRSWHVYLSLFEQRVDCLSSHNHSLNFSFGWYQLYFIDLGRENNENESLRYSVQWWFLDLRQDEVLVNFQSIFRFKVDLCFLYSCRQNGKYLIQIWFLAVLFKN